MLIQLLMELYRMVVHYKYRGGRWKLLGGPRNSSDMYTNRRTPTGDFQTPKGVKMRSEGQYFPTNSEVF